MKGKKLLMWSGVLFFVVAFLALFLIFRTVGRTQVQINIHQNKQLIYLSTFAEPPQFAIWLENPNNHKCQTVFVTKRAGIGDWEGKSEVPVALPRWFELFTAYGKAKKEDDEEEIPLTVTGATPKTDYFSIRAEVKSGSKWICWIEMNLAGDFNESFPEKDLGNFKVDEFSNGQPALLFRSEFIAEKGLTFSFKLVAQSIWDNGKKRVEPVSDGVTSAKNVFDQLSINIIQPKPKLIDKTRIQDI
jgi:hypothetical protein